MELIPPYDRFVLIDRINKSRKLS